MRFTTVVMIAVFVISSPFRSAAQFSFPPAAGGGGGSGTVTSVVIAGTANQITATGTCTVTISGTCTLAIPSGAVLVAPVLGTPASVTLTNGTGLPINSGVSGLGTGIAGFLATPTSANFATAVTDETGSGALVFGTSPTLVTPALGTPSALVLTNATGLPVAGMSNLGAGVGTFLITPSSANLAAAITDETGSGALVFAASPTFTGTVSVGTSLSVDGTTGITVASKLGNAAFSLLNGAGKFSSGVPVGQAACADLSDASATCATAGAVRALSNLASVSINAALIPQTTLDLGAAATAWRNLYIYGQGTFGSHSLKFDGAPTGNRTVTFPDASITVARTDAAQTFTGVQTFTGPILGTPTSGTLTNATGLPAVGVVGTAAVGGGNLSTVGAIPYVSASGAVNQASSFIVTNPGVASETWTFKNPVATTGATRLVISKGAADNVSSVTLSLDASATFAGNIVVTQGIRIGSSNVLDWAAGGGIFGNATTGALTGTVRITGGTGVAINLGGDTSSFPAWKRSTTGILARLADDSGDTFISGSYVRAVPVAVASLPACAAGTDGARAAVNDSNAASFTAGIGAIVAAGGSTHVPVSCDGTNWRIG